MESPDTLIGKTVGERFNVHRRLAAGGMGVVYKAEQVPLGRPVALKVLRPPADSSQYENYCRRFLLEAAAVANLNHPHTVTVHDYGREGDLLYFAMEFLDGQTLETRIHEAGPMHPEDAIYVALQVCSSLGDAHRNSLVHRDLKPSNVMFTQQKGDALYIKVLDFGLVKIVSNDPGLKLTQQGVMLGSPRFMSPEQVSGAPVDPRTDVYSLGAVIFFMLTGKAPFHAGSQFDAMRSHLHTPPPTLRSVFEACTASPQLEAVLQRCLQKDPEDRYPTMEELAQALKACRQSGQQTYIPRSSHAQPAAAQLQTGQPVMSQPGHPHPHTPPPPGAVPDGRAGHGPMAIAGAVGQSMATSDRTKMLIAGGLFLALFGLGGLAMAMFTVYQRQRVPTPTAPVIVALPTTPAVPLDPPNPPATPAALPTKALANADTTAMNTEGAAAATAQGDTPNEEASPAESLRTIEVRSVPSGARVTLDGDDLGDTPVALRVPEGESRELELSAQGYHDRAITIETSQEIFTVRLERMRTQTSGHQSTRTTRMTMSPEESMRGIRHQGPVRDPWAE